MSETFDSDIFNLAPTPRWIEDFSEVQALFDVWRAQGVTDIRTFLLGDKERVAQCSRRIKVLDVNNKTLELFEAEHIDHLRANLSTIFRDDMLDTHVIELASLFDGGRHFRKHDVQLHNLRSPPGYSASRRRYARLRDVARQAASDDRGYHGTRRCQTGRG